MSLTDPKSKRITASIVKMIVTDLRPANVVEGLGFVDLMATTAPEYPLAKAEYYSQKVRDLYATKSAENKAGVSETSGNYYRPVDIHRSPCLHGRHGPLRR